MSILNLDSLFANLALMTEGETRTDRRKAVTRARLVSATQAVVASKGMSVAIADITEEADVALGTFYNYFESKDEVLQVLADEIAEDLAEVLHDAAATFDDPADALADAVTRFLEWFEADATRASFVVNTTLGQRTLRHHLGSVVEGIMKWGADTGRFPAPAAAGLAALSVGGVIITFMWARVQGLVPADVAEQALVVQILRLAGVPHEEAVVIASRTEG